MFLCQPLLDVLIARVIEDIDSIIQPPSWNDLPDSASIPVMIGAADRVLAAVGDKQRIDHLRRLRLRRDPRHAHSALDSG
jgi:hypothetical protein